jgi:hypothetical protein
VSPVATAEPEVRQWTRTPEQEQLITDHLLMVEREWSTTDPELVAELNSTDVMDSEAIRIFLGYTATTRVYQLYSNDRDLAEVDQLPHPSALPPSDSTFGRRGPRQIRGMIRGRVVHWAIQSGRIIWDPFAKQLIVQDKIQFGGAPRR